MKRWSLWTVLAVSLFLMSSVWVQGEVSFMPPRYFDVGNGPLSIAVADLNGDGALDLAVANLGEFGIPSTVSILLGNGDGTFQTVQNYDVGIQPQKVVVSDFNGDGYPDLAVTNWQSHNLSILLGNGDGTFQPARNYELGAGPGALVVGDFDGDQVMDLVVIAERVQGVLLMLRGNGDGTFQPSQEIPMPYTTSSGVIAADFNGDMKLDLAVLHTFSSYEPGTLSIHLGNGDGTFQPPQAFATGATAVSPSLGDFNEDGIVDVAHAAYSGGGAVSILLGDGQGHSL